MSDLSESEWMERFDQDFDFQLELEADKAIGKDSKIVNILSGLYGIRFEAFQNNMQQYEDELYFESELPNRWEWYDSSVQKTLTVEKEMHFLKIIEDNPKLATEFRLYKEGELMMKDVASDEMVRSLENLETNLRPQNKYKFIRTNWIPKAAIMLLLISASVWVFTLNRSEESFSDQLIGTAHTVLRGATDQSPDLAKFSAEELNRFLIDTTIGINIAVKNLLVGNQLFNRQMYEEASLNFLKVIDSSDDRYILIAKWNLAISYLQQGRKNESITLLNQIAEDSANGFSQKAIDLIDKID